MVEESSKRGGGGSYGALDPRTVAALRAVLALDADTAAEVRECSPSRHRPVPQYGPRLDLGDDRDDGRRRRNAAVDGADGGDGSDSVAP